MHLYHGVMASNPLAKVRQVTKSGCSPLIGVTGFNPEYDGSLNRANRCIEFNERFLGWLKKNEEVQFVIISSPFEWVGHELISIKDGLTIESDVNFVLERFFETVDLINGFGIGAVLVSSTPRSGFDIGNCLAKKYQFNEKVDCNFVYSASSFQHDFFKAVEDRVPVYWLHKDICKGGVCSAEKNNTFIYADASHLSKEGSAFLGKSNDWFTNLKGLALRFNSLTPSMLTQ